MSASRFLRAAGALILAASLGVACSESETEVLRIQRDGTFRFHDHDGFPHYVGHFRARSVQTRQHDASTATGGLSWYEDVLFESGGGQGSSFLASSDSNRVDLDGNYSATGLAIYNDQLYQLTGGSGEVLVYDVATLEQADTLKYSGEAWGVCNKDDEFFVMSNGTSQLTTRSLSTFDFIKSILVTLNGEDLAGLNELECVGDQIWANIADPDNPGRSSTIVAIDSNTGEVEATIDASDIQSENLADTDAMPLNGISVRDDATMWIAGQGWPEIHQIELVPVDV